MQRTANPISQKTVAPARSAGTTVFGKPGLAVRCKHVQRPVAKTVASEAGSY